MGRAWMVAFGAAVGLLAADGVQAAYIPYTGSLTVGSYNAAYTIWAPDVVGRVSNGSTNPFVLKASTTFTSPNAATFTTTDVPDHYLYVGLGSASNQSPLFVTSDTVNGQEIFSLHFDFTIGQAYATVYNDFSGSTGIGFCYQARNSSGQCEYTNAGFAGFHDDTPAAIASGNHQFLQTVTADDQVIATSQPIAVPEPAAWALLLAGMAGVAGVRRWRHGDGGNVAKP